jgi:hypothetical protein
MPELLAAGSITLALTAVVLGAIRSRRVLLSDLLQDGWEKEVAAPMSTFAVINPLMLTGWWSFAGRGIYGKARASFEARGWNRAQRGEWPSLRRPN